MKPSAVPDHVFNVAAGAAQESSDKADDPRLGAAIDTAISYAHPLDSA
jgi:hypothetical protein